LGNINGRNTMQHQTKQRYKRLLFQVFAALLAVKPGYGARSDHKE